MPVITAIRAQRRRTDRCNLFVDDAFWRSAPLDLVIERGLKVGSELDEAEMGEIDALCQRQWYLESAYRALAMRSRTTRELGQRLRQRGAGDEDVSFCLNRCAELGLLDDREAGIDMARSLRARGLARSMARGRLRAAGLGDEDITAALESEYDASDAQIARDAAATRPSETDAARLTAWLRRRGHSPRDCDAALREMGLEISSARTPRPAPDIELITSQLQARYADLSDAATRRRAWGWLARRGVPSDQIRSLLTR